MNTTGRLAASCRLPGFERETPPVTRIYRAGLLLPVDAPPVPGGALAVADGRILALGPAAEILADYPDAPLAVELPDAVLMPGLVNAHCHLGLSFAQGLLPPTEDFVAWIQRLLPLRGTWTEREHRLSIAAGLRETLRGGCTLLGEIVTDSEVDTGALLAAERAPLRIRAYREVLGWLPAHRRAGLDRITTSPGAVSSWDGPGELRPGLSPHAPYSTHPELYGAMMSHAAERELPLCSHVAETADELRYMSENRGPLADLLERIGWSVEGPALWNDGDGFVDWLAEQELHGPFLLVHGTWLSAEEIITLAGRREASVAYCPGSVAWFHGGEDPHPVAHMLAAGLPVALGTDSLASSPTLNLPLTCTLARRAHPELEPGQILRMATRAGALALGFPDCGRLAVGGPADFVAFALPGVGDASRLNLAEAVEGVLLSGYRVPNLHVISGVAHAFAALRPFPA